jgi:hypothetical protein
MENVMIDTIDILITSTSRPSLLRQTVASMQDRIKFSGKLRWLLHEDCLDEIKSAELIHWAGYSTIFDHISVSRPRIGLGQSIHSMFEHIKSPIFFRSDDDWEYVEDIYLDPLVAIFEKYNEINQIVFSKRCIDGQKRDFVRESYEYEKTWLTISNQW